MIRPHRTNELNDIEKINIKGIKIPAVIDKEIPNDNRISVSNNELIFFIVLR